MNDSLHPENALDEPNDTLEILPACEHIAGSERFITKAMSLAEALSFPFDLTLDLEDGAPQGQEGEQRQLIVDTLMTKQASAPAMGMRIHPYDSEHFLEDLGTILPKCASHLAYITIPKTQSTAQLQEAIQKINELSPHNTKIPLHVLIETPQAVEEVWQIAQLDQVEVLDFGSMDFISSHQGAIPESCMMSPGQFEHALVRRAKERICAAALAFQKTPAHNVCVNFKDIEQVFSDASRAYREFGFLRMWSIYPTHIEAITKAMTPDSSELRLATCVLLAGRAANWGPINFEDRLHDRASYRYYWSILKRAQQLGADIPSDAMNIFFVE